MRRNLAFPEQIPAEVLLCITYALAGRHIKGDSGPLGGCSADCRPGRGPSKRVRQPAVAECRAISDQRGVKLPPGLTDARVYDLRHTFASVGAGGGLSLQIIGRLLGHTQAKTTQRYAHLADSPLYEAVAKISAQIAGAGKSKPNVVPLPKRGGAA